jgi:hypothetical protein
MNPENGLNVWMMRLYIVLAATAGAVTGAVIDKSLTLQGKATAFFVGLSGSVFLGPLILARFFPGNILTPEAAGCYYLLATVCNAAIPNFVKFASRRAGDPLSFLRAKGGDA